MQEKDKKDFAFINEKIKEKPLNKRRMLIQAAYIVVMAVVFGVVAGIVFTCVQPKMEEMMYPKKDPVVSIPKDEPTEETEQSEDAGEEGTENSEISDTETQTTEEANQTEEAEDTQTKETEVSESPVIEYMPPTLEDYQKLQNEMYAIGREANKFIVTVTGVKSDTDWFNNPYERKGQASGIIIANNGEELLILTEKKVLSDAQEIFVTFINDDSVQAVIKKYDGNTGITVLSVPLESVEESTMSAISVATLGNSLSVTQGNLVLAVGSPLGTNYSILTGNITATTNVISTIDANYKVFTTDIVSSMDGSGALINLNGEVIGLVMQDYGNAGDENTLTAVSISELKTLIEMLSNNQDIPYLGLGVKTVTSAIANEYEIPKGVYIKDVAMDSPAMAAGLQSGDVLAEINGVTVYTEESYEGQLLSTTPGELISVLILRQGSEGYTEIECEVEVSVLP